MAIAFGYGCEGVPDMLDPFEYEEPFEKRYLVRTSVSGVTGDREWR
jgi:hypothetical protein